MMNPTEVCDPLTFLKHHQQVKCFSISEQHIYRIYNMTTSIRRTFMVPRGWTQTNWSPLLSFLLRTDTTSVFDWNVSTTVIWIVVSYGGLAAVWLQNFTWLSISTSVCGWWLIFYFRVNRCAWIQPHKAASTAAAALILVNLVLDRQYRHTCWYRSFK